MALPRLRGERIDGVPQTARGFVVDMWGRVEGLGSVFAAGDITTFPSSRAGSRRSRPMRPPRRSPPTRCGRRAGAVPAGAPRRAPNRRGAAYLRHEAGGPSAPGLRRRSRPSGGRPSRSSGATSRRSSARGRRPSPRRRTTTRLRKARSASSNRRCRRAGPRRRCSLRPRRRRRARRGRRGTSCSRTSSSSPPRTRSARSPSEGARDVGSALVLDYGRLIGIITARDLLRAFAGRVHASEARAREWMTAEPVAVAAAPWRAVTLMLAHGFTTSRWSRTSARSGCSASARPSAARPPRAVGLGL